MTDGAFCVVQPLLLAASLAAAGNACRVAADACSTWRAAGNGCGSTPRLAVAVGSASVERCTFIGVEAARAVDIGVDDVLTGS
ncbi:hypothetical protein D3C87_1645830 [compost metagenome]